MKIELDMNCMETAEKAHEYLAGKLELPDYYGKNLDALYDCLTEMNDLEIRVINYRESNTDCGRILQIMRYAGIEVEIV